MKLKNYFLMILTIVLVQACGKKDETPAAVTKTALLSRTWTITTFTVSPALNGVTNLLTGATACDLDDITVFNSNGNYTVEEGATKCSPSDPQIYERGTWRFVNNETQLETTETGSSPIVSNISELTASRMVQTVTERVNTTNYTFTITYAAR